MDYQFYSVDKKPPIAWIYLNRPKKLNAMNPPAWEELIPICQDIDADDSIRVAIIASKASIFCAGIDLVGMMPELPELMVKEQMGGLKLKLLQKIHQLQDGLSCLVSCRKPIIAAVHGKCIGAGLDMITACDIRLCTADALFSLREAKVGFVADVGVLQRLPHIVGQGITRELAYTAKDVDADYARRASLVNHVYPDQDTLLKAAEQMAHEIAECSPLAVMASKDVLNYGIGKTVEDGLWYVASMSANIIPSNDLFEAVTAFTEKRKPNFPGT